VRARCPQRAGVLKESLLQICIAVFQTAENRFAPRIHSV
jgi:hypothetical protein